MAAPMTTIGLWRLNPITGLWRRERDCRPEDADQWLAIFQRDEPGVIFKVSKVKPKP